MTGGHVTDTAVTRPWVRVASTVLRLGLGGVWLAAGALKVGAPEGMVRSVRAFRLVPEALVHPVAYGLPFVEVALGLLLVVGLATRATAVVSGVLFAMYLAAISSAAARGLRIDCGCFSTGGDLAAGAPTHYTEEIVRDGLLLAASGVLAAWPASYLALDRILGDTPRAVPPDDDPPTAFRDRQAPPILPAASGDDSPAASHGKQALPVPPAASGDDPPTALHGKQALPVPPAASGDDPPAASHGRVPVASLEDPPGPPGFLRPAGDRPNLEQR